MREKNWLNWRDLTELQDRAKTRVFKAECMVITIGRKFKIGEIKTNSDYTRRALAALAIARAAYASAQIARSVAHTLTLPF